MDVEDVYYFMLCVFGVVGCMGFVCVLLVCVFDVLCIVMGFMFCNLVGFVVGFDKDGVVIDGFVVFGFGFIEVGIVMLCLQFGNLCLWMFWLLQVEVLINWMGFNNYGVDQFVKNVQVVCYCGIFGLNIGKNVDMLIECVVEDYLYCFECVYLFVSYVMINILLLNMKNLCQLQGVGEFDVLFVVLKDKQQCFVDLYGKFVLFVLKIVFDFDDEQVKEIGDMLLCYKIEVVIVINMMLLCVVVQGLLYVDEVGGLLGCLVFDVLNEVICKLYVEVGNDVLIIGVGGIFFGEDVCVKLVVGVVFVQFYIGFIYCGLVFVLECVKVIVCECIV